MRDEIRLLIQLQELDGTVRSLHATRQKLLKDLAEVDKAAAAEAQSHEDRSNEAKAFRRAIDKRELDLKDIEGRIQKYDSQLNQAKTNKEYAALQHEILGLKADKSRIEDDILKMYEQVEAQASEVKEGGKRVTEAQKAAAERRKTVETAIADAVARVERIRKERADLAAKIPPNFLQPYERLLQKADGRAMAPCRNYVCQGCRMSLTANTVNLLLIGDKLVFCQSCGRILFMPENEDLTSIAAAGRKDNW